MNNKLIDIWKRLGRQPLHITQHTDAKVFIGDREYYITDIRYENGQPLGFNAALAKEESIIDTLNELKKRNPGQSIIIESSDGALDMRIGDAKIYEGMNGEIVTDSE